MPTRGGAIGLALFVAVVLGAAWLWLAGGAEPGLAEQHIVASESAAGAVELPAPVAGAPPAAQPPAPRTSGEVSILGGRRVAGCVVRASDLTPLVGASVSWDDETGRGVETSADGRFELTVPSAAERVRAAAFGFAVQLALPQGDDELSDLRLVVPTGYRVTGTVFGDLSMPLAGAQVSVLGLEWSRATTDADGRFVLHDVGPVGRGEAHLTASADWHADGGRTVPLPADTLTVDAVVIRLVPTGSIVGVIDDPQGRPAFCATVTPRVYSWGIRAYDQPRDAVTNHIDGSFRVDQLQPGTWVLEIGSVGALVGRWTRAVEVVAGRASRLDVVLHPGASVSGRVVKSDGGPAVRARVRVERRECWNESGIDDETLRGVRSGIVVKQPGPQGDGRVTLLVEESTGRTDASGEYSIDGLSPGPKRLVFRGPDPRQLLATRELSLAPGEERVGFDARLLEGLIVAGTVREASGELLPDAWVSALHRIDGIPMEIASAASDERGRFKLTGLPDAPLEITTQRKGWLSRVDTVRPGGDALELTLEAAPHIEGRVIDALSGEPIRLFFIRVSSGERFFTVKNQNWQGPGGFRCIVSEDFDYDITVTAPGFVDRTVAVRPSGTLSQPVVIALHPER